MHKKLELLVIDPSIIRPEIETFHLIARLSKIPVSFHLPALEGMDTLWEAEKSAQCIGAIVLGSAASVREERDWQTELIRWLKRKIHPHFPLLGICFGHQLFAHMYGSAVVDVGHKNVGFRKVKIIQDDRLQLSRREVPLFVAHNDKVNDVPNGFEIFASSDSITIDGLRHKTLPIWGFQPHIDATETFALNSHYSDRTHFSDLKEGNDLLNKFLEFTSRCAREQAGKRQNL